MDAAALTFISDTRTAAMTTLRRDGTPHTVRVGVTVVDGKIWSSGTQDRVRTRHLRRDPRSTLFVFDSQFRWLSLDCAVRILDGADAPQQNLRLFQVMQSAMTPAPAPGKLTWFGRECTEPEFLAIMEQEQRLIYEFAPTRTYGMYAATP
jgi:PPOX class probable F420-dependent enzyme